MGGRAKRRCAGRERMGERKESKLRLGHKINTFINKKESEINPYES